MEYRPKYTAFPYSIGIVVSQFNETITNQLYEGAKRTLKEHDVDQITTYFVPGAFEIPLMAKKMAESKEFDAIITLGAVIQGETPHFDFVSAQVAAGVQTVSLETRIPVIFGVLTCNTIEQALTRSGIKGSNKGVESAQTALKMLSLLPLKSKSKT
ncbi:6,7-dimethyl-8-ribityllumazine synthase [Chlamydiales bacterium]|nr:6,7-dimethyl-8-ribityllumazine synthase [Chlamydiales bacterium]